jgi:hypothetical protein
MIDFSNFYQLIAKSPLSHWLETLPAQVAAWQRDALHGNTGNGSGPSSFCPSFRPTDWICCIASPRRAKRRWATASVCGLKTC